MHFKRDHMGFIELEKLPIKERQVINVFNACTFLLKGKRYYFKELKNTNRCYNELVGYELAKDFGMEAVPYDIASYDGFIGYLSEDYMKPGYSCLDDLYDKYFEHDTRNRCNLDDVSMFLRDTYPEFAENIIYYIFACSLSRNFAERSPRRGNIYFNKVVGKMLFAVYRVFKRFFRPR